MSAPSWPRIAARLAAPAVRTARGRWRARGEDGAEHGGTFAHRAPDDWAVLDADGRPAEERWPRRLLQPAHWHGGDYCRAAGPPVAAEHDGRPAWRVELEPPAHKRGRLVLVVDAATGLCVAMSNAELGAFVEIVDLEVNVEVDEALFEPARRARAEHERMAALYELCVDRPPPTPRWFPWRRGYPEAAGCLVVESDAGEGAVSRAPLGQPAPVPDVVPGPVVRFDAAGWSWAVAGPGGADEETARRVVAGVVDRRPAQAPPAEPLR